MAVLEALEVSPPFMQLALQTSGKLQVVGKYSDGSLSDLTGSVVWSSGDSAIAEVTGGVVRALTPGNATITAQLGQVRGEAHVLVSNAGVEQILVEPGMATTNVSGTVSFSATAALSDGTTQDLTDTVTWSTSDPGIADVSAEGVATALAPGECRIQASMATLVGKATLTVTASELISIDLTPSNPIFGVGINTNFTATGSFADGTIADVTTSVSWASSALDTLLVDQQGLATSLAAGTSIVSATIGPITGSTTVTVIESTLSAIRIEPSTLALALGGTQQLAAIGEYEDGTAVDLTQSVTWSSDNPAVVFVSNAYGFQGLITGLAGGAATISAQLGSISGSASIVVFTAELTRITLSPDNPGAPLGTMIRFEAQGTYSDGRQALIANQVTWSSDAPDVASVSNAGGKEGQATAVTVGETFIRAALDGVEGSTLMTVTAATLQSIQVTPADQTLDLGLKEFYTATGTYSDGTTLDLTSTVVWSVAEMTVAAISNAAGAQGLLTALDTGTTQVEATLGAVSGSTSLTVISAEITEVKVSPIQLSLAAGQFVQFTAMAIFSNGTSQNVTTQAQWSSSDSGVADFASGPGGTWLGRVETLAPGQTVITADYKGHTGSGTITVTNAVVTSIAVAPINPTLPLGAARRFLATAIFSDNTSKDVTTQATWTSSDPAVAEVTSSSGKDAKINGRVKALSPGQATITASYQGVSGTSLVTVSSAELVSITVYPVGLTVPVGSTGRLTATAILSDNTSINITNQATWTSSDPSVAQVITSSGKGNLPGQAVALSPGTVTIMASLKGITGSAEFTVTDAVVEEIQIWPAQPQVAQGIPVKFSAVAIFSDSTTRTVTNQATWISSDPSVVTVSTTLLNRGLAVTLAPGTVTISATYQGVTGETTLTVTGAQLTTIQITPFSPTLPVGFITRFQATGIYADNTTQDLTGLVTWLTSDPAVAVVSNAPFSKGRVTPLAAGLVTISAAYAGVTGENSVTVTSAALESLEISPADAMISVGEFVPFTATGAFSDGSTLNVTGYVTWLSSAPLVADISNATGSRGQAKGLSPGGVTITAIRGAITGEASLTVLPE